MHDVDDAELHRRALTGRQAHDGRRSGAIELASLSSTYYIALSLIVDHGVSD